MDFQLRDDAELRTIPERMNAALPEGIRVLEVYPSENKAKYLKWLRVEGRLEYDAGNAAEIAGRLSEFYRQSELVITRKTKRGEGETNIIPAIREISAEAAENGKMIVLHAVISAQEPTLNPELLISALRQKAPELVPDFSAFQREEVYFENGEVFR